MPGDPRWIKVMALFHGLWRGTFMGAPHSLLNPVFEECLSLSHTKDGEMHGSLRDLSRDSSAESQTIEHLCTTNEHAIRSIAYTAASLF
jgi:hypothetical protein